MRWVVVVVVGGDARTEAVLEGAVGGCVATEAGHRDAGAGGTAVVADWRIEFLDVGVCEIGRCGAVTACSKEEIGEGVEPGLMALGGLGREFNGAAGGYDDERFAM